MKYYIPTSSLNLNAILSMESIAPKNFYQSRNFGYKKLYDIPVNCNASQILMFEYPGHFNCFENDLADFPMLIEFDTDKDFPLLQDGVHYSDHTIYLNPWHTRFLFFRPGDMKTAISLLQGSLETKLLRLYQNHIQLIQINAEDYPMIAYEPQSAILESYLDDDTRKNSIKGLLYGYYIGFLLSSDKESVDKLIVYRKIYDVFSAIMSTTDKQATPRQLNELNDLYSEIKASDPVYRKLLEFEGSKSRVESLLVLLKECGHEVVKEQLSNLINQNILYPGSLDWVRNKIHDLTEQMRCKLHGLSVDKREIFTLDGLSIELDPSVVENEDELELFQYWVNHYFTVQGYVGKVGARRSTVADDITDKAIECLGDKWKGSSVRVFLNALRHHIAGKEFSQIWNNGVLSSMAAVILKGDDWESLLSFMQQKGMNDYRLAFALYGSMIGFANLTRDFTDILLNRKSNYVAEVYKEFHAQLHNERIINKVEAVSPQTIGSTSHSKSYLHYVEDIIKVLESDGRIMKYPTAVNYYRTHLERIALSSPSDDLFWQEVKSIAPFNNTKRAWNDVVSQLEKEFNQTMSKPKSTGRDSSIRKISANHIYQTSMFGNLNTEKYEKSIDIIHEFLSRDNSLIGIESKVIENLHYALAEDTTGDWKQILNHWNNLLLPKDKKRVSNKYRIEDTEQNRDTIKAIKTRLLTL